MNASNVNTAAKILRGWWASPPRRGIRRLIIPWEYRHLRGFGLTRIAGGYLPVHICSSLSTVSRPPGRRLYIRTGCSTPSSTRSQGFVLKNHDIGEPHACEQREYWWEREKER